MSILTNSRFKGKVLERVPLAPYTSFKIGGKVDYLVFPSSWDDVLFVLEESYRRNFPIKIMGQGSNILVSDEGLHGVIIKISRNLGKIERIDDVYLEIESGCLIAEVLNFLINNNLGGLEFLAGIPGNIGGAVYGNAGAWGKSIGEYVEEVRIIDRNLDEKILNKKQLSFGYRISNINDGCIIKSVIIKTFKQEKEKTYNIILNYLKERRKKLPKLPSAGSIFKNPPSQNAGYLLESVGMKGTRVGNVMVSYEHANIIVNLGGGKAEEVKELIKMMREKVESYFGIHLELEIKIW
ncbi:MAG: UDP-N-acetylmuramate dehydrogenase [Dictyoglomaceae bacterium]